MKSISYRSQKCLFSSIIILLFIGVLGLNAQQNPYYIVQYYNVEPSMENEYLLLENDVWKKIHKARIESDLLDGWHLFRVISPTGSKTEYNYVLILEYDNVEKLAKHFEEFGVDYTQILSAEEIAFALKTPEIREVAYEEIWTAVDEMMKDQTSSSYRFQVFNAMKFKPGITAEDYQAIEQTYWKPAHQMRMAQGKMFGWGIYNMVIPGGTEREYSWATVDYYNNFVEVMEGTGSLLEVIHGKKNAEKYLEETNAKRDLLRTEIRELLDYMTDEMIDNE